MTDIKDGDIYFWKWKDLLGRFMPYHCWSQKAVVRDGVLHDTYWSPQSHRVSLDKVVLFFVANINDLTEIRAQEAPYYRSDDVVDMRHENDSGAKVYVKTGAKRDPAAMKKLASHEIEHRKYEISSANNRIEELNVAIAAIDAGQLDDVYIPVRRKQS